MFTENTNVGVNDYTRDDYYSAVEIFVVGGPVELWERAFRFFISRGSEWDFLLTVGGDFSNKCGEGFIGLVPFSVLSTVIVPRLYDDSDLYREFFYTFYGKQVNNGKVLYLCCDDLVGIINEVRFELSYLLGCDLDTYPWIINSIALARVVSIGKLTNEVFLNEKSNISIVHFSGEPSV